MISFYLSNIKNIFQNLFINMGVFESLKFINFCIFYYFYKILKIKNNSIEIIRFKNQNVAISYNPGDIGSFLEIFNQNEYSTIFELVEPEKIKPFVLIDLGANVGYNFFYFNNFNILKKYIAVEPYYNNLQLLTFNTFSEKTTIISKAVWTHNKGMLFTNTGISNSNLISEAGEIKVETITLNEILKDYKNEDLFLKMDIEGAEYQILNQELDLISKKIKYFVIEFHDIMNQDYKKFTKKLSPNFDLIEKVKEGRYSLVFGLNKNL